MRSLSDTLNILYYVKKALCLVEVNSHLLVNYGHTCENLWNPLNDFVFEAQVYSTTLHAYSLGWQTRP